MKDIKLIFFDIDGTLLDANGQWGQHLASEIQRLHAIGIKLAIASGRPSFAAKFIFDALPITDAGLFCSGAEIYDPKQSKHLHIHTLAKEDVIGLYDRAKALDIYTEFYTSDRLFVPNITSLTQIHAEHLRVKPIPCTIETLLSQHHRLTKLLLANDEEKFPQRLTQLAEEFPRLEFAFANFLAYPGWRFASVINREASKHLAFKQLLEYHRVSAEEVAAFGDSHSDEVFIELAGLGVAMGNATSENLKRKANLITADVQHGGVEMVLETIGRTS